MLLLLSSSSLHLHCLSRCFLTPGEDRGTSKGRCLAGPLLLPTALLLVLDGPLCPSFPKYDPRCNTWLHLATMEHRRSHFSMSAATGSSMQWEGQRPGPAGLRRVLRAHHQQLAQQGRPGGSAPAATPPPSCMASCWSPAAASATPTPAACASTSPARTAGGIGPGWARPRAGTVWPPQLTMPTCWGAASWAPTASAWTWWPWSATAPSPGTTAHWGEHSQAGAAGGAPVPGGELEREREEVSEMCAVLQPRQPTG